MNILKQIKKKKKNKKGEYFYSPKILIKVQEQLNPSDQKELVQPVQTEQQYNH